MLTVRRRLDDNRFFADKGQRALVFSSQRVTLVINTCVMVWEHTQRLQMQEELNVVE